MGAYELARRTRARGITAPATDVLIVACAQHHGASLLHADSHFDLRVPPSNRLHRLERDRQRQYAISINDQWRICFRFVEGDTYDVEVADYD